MLNLVVLTPCLDVLTGSDGSISLIRLADKAIVKVPPGLTVPPDAEFSRPVIIFTAWARPDAGTRETFQQRLRIRAPSGKTVMEKITNPLEIGPDALGHAVLTTLQGFPANEQGLYTIDVAVRAGAHSGRWRPANSMRFLVEHVTNED